MNDIGVPSGTAPGTDAAVVLGAEDINRSLKRLAYEIAERTPTGHIVLLGIPTRGADLARRLFDLLGATDAADRVTHGTLDITAYRDDLRRQPIRAMLPTSIPPGGIDDAIVVLVDDVLFSGRTVRAALDALADIGRPAAVRLAVLVDRGHRELPIRPDFVGKNLPTSRAERVRVALAEVDGEDAVTIIRDAQATRDAQNGAIR